jgi:hypothetical protein
MVLWFGHSAKEQQGGSSLDASSNENAQSRVRETDWVSVIKYLDEHPNSITFIGEMDQSIRTHIRKGRFKYIDPNKYDVWTKSVDGSRTRANIYMRKKPVESG